MLLQFEHFVPSAERGCSFFSFVCLFDLCTTGKQIQSTFRRFGNYFLGLKFLVGGRRRINFGFGTLLGRCDVEQEREGDPGR